MDESFDGMDAYLAPATPCRSNPEQIVKKEKKTTFQESPGAPSNTAAAAVNAVVAVSAAGVAASNNDAAYNKDAASSTATLHGAICAGRATPVNNSTPAVPQPTTPKPLERPFVTASNMRTPLAEASPYRSMKRASSFCTVENLSSSLTYINHALASFGYPQTLAVGPGCSKEDAAAVVNCLLVMLQNRQVHPWNGESLLNVSQKDLEFREDLEMRIRRLYADNEQLVSQVVIEWGRRMLPVSFHDRSVRNKSWRPVSAKWTAFVSSYSRMPDWVFAIYFRQDYHWRMAAKRSRESSVQGGNQSIETQSSAMQDPACGRYFSLASLPLILHYSFSTHTSPHVSSMIFARKKRSLPK